MSRSAGNWGGWLGGAGLGNLAWQQAFECGGLLTRSPSPRAAMRRSPEWQRSQSEGLSIDLGIRLFSNNELDGLFLESPTSLHLSPPAVSKRRRLSEDSLSHVFDDDVEPCAKRHRWAPDFLGVLECSVLPSQQQQRRRCRWHHVPADARNLLDGPPPPHGTAGSVMPRPALACRPLTSPAPQTSMRCSPPATASPHGRV